MSEREQEVERIFRGFLELGDVGRRSVFLSRECGADDALRRRVEALVRAHENSAGFLDSDVAGDCLDDSGGGVGLAGRRIGGYRVLRPVSGGASCVVYLAEQLEPVRRPVALKLARPDGGDVEVASIRFAAECQAMAVLDHPNVVQLYDAGEWEGLPYIVTEWVDGEGLLTYAQRESLSLGERVELFLQGCLAVAHCHERGVVHRDIKPANVLVMECGGEALVKVIDFGVAGACGHAVGGGEGTPGYMSPEQLDGGFCAVDLRGDVYALGVLLHELLTGAVPLMERGVGWVGYEGGGEAGDLDLWMGMGLEGVLLRALAWERDGRYGSVAELRGSLEECIDRVGRGGRAVRARSYRVMMAVVGVLMGLGVAWVAHLFWDGGFGMGVGERGVGLARQHEVEAMGRSDISDALYWATRGVVAGKGRGLGQGRVAEVMVRRVAWPVGVLQTGGLVQRMAFSPSGRYVALLVEGEGCLVWDWRSEEYALEGEGLEAGVSFGWAMGVDWLAVGRVDGVLEVWNVSVGGRVMRAEAGECLGAVTFSQDGRYLAAAGRGLWLWDMGRGGWLSAGWEHPGEIYGLDFSVGGERVVTACDDGRARVFRLGGDDVGIELVEELQHARRVGVESAELCCENALVETDPVVPLLVGEDGVLSWSGLGRMSYRVGDREVAVVGDTCHATRMVRSGDGEWVAVALRKGGLEYRRVDGFVGGKAGRVEHGERVFDVDFDTARGWLLTASADRTVGVWGLGSGELVYPLMKHSREVVHGDLSEDGRWVATAQLDGQVRVWALPGGEVHPVRLWDGPEVGLEGVIGARVLVRVDDGGMDLGWLDVGEGEASWDMLGVDGELVSVAGCEASGELGVISRGLDRAGGQVRIWSGGVSREVLLPFVPWAMEWRPGGGGMVLADGEGSLWSLAEEGGVELLVESAIGGEGGRFEFSGGGDYLVCWRGRMVVGVFDAWTGLRVEAWEGSGGGGIQMILSAVGDLGLVVEGGEFSRVEALGDRRLMGVVLRHAGGLVRSGFSPDGRWVVTAGHDGRMLIRDWKTGALACPPLEHGEEVVDWLFGGDGMWVATVSRAGVLRVWDTAFGFLLSPAWSVLESGSSVRLAELGGDLLVVGGRRGWVWEVGGGGGLLGLSRAEIGLVGEVVSGLGGERGELLSSEGWGERMERLKSLGLGLGWIEAGGRE